MGWVVALCLIAATVATTLAAVEATNRYLRWYIIPFEDKDFD